MSQMQRLVFEENGQTYEIAIEPTPSAIEPSSEPENAPVPMGVGQAVTDKMQQIQRTIRGYSICALKAFQNLGLAEVEEVKLSFGVSLEASTGIPYITTGSTKSNLTVEVKCKFPSSSQS